MSCLFLLSERQTELSLFSFVSQQSAGRQQHRLCEPKWPAMVQWKVVPPVSSSAVLDRLRAAWSTTRSVAKQSEPRGVLSIAVTTAIGSGTLSPKGAANPASRRQKPENPAGL